MFNIVLLEPEIPANTGNIGRTCVATDCRLHLIRPFGFIINDKMLKRSGLDYWPRLDVSYYDDWEDFLTKNPGADLYFATTKGRHVYSDVKYPEGAYIVFGRESGGIPEEILMQHPKRCVRIPMAGEERSLNLSNSVAIVLYEALRQHDFSGLTMKGQLHNHKWKPEDM